MNYILKGGKTGIGGERVKELEEALKLANHYTHKLEQLIKQ